jgi:hypothetical protein
MVNWGSEEGDVLDYLWAGDFGGGDLTGVAAGE